jgi:hypothetical protein
MHQTGNTKVVINGWLVLYPVVNEMEPCFPLRGTC